MEGNDPLETSVENLIHRHDPGETDSLEGGTDQPDQKDADESPLRGRPPGYWVECKEARGGLVFFPDTLYGGAAGAYQAARHWLLHDSPDFADRRNISRIDQRDRRAKATVGWQVRIQRKKKKYSEFFSDNLYGGGEKAFASAQYWRDLKKEALPDVKSYRPADIRRGASQFGITGMRVVIRQRGTSEEGRLRLQPALEISWPSEENKGGLKHRSVSLEGASLGKVTRELCERLEAERGKIGWKPGMLPKRIERKYEALGDSPENRKERVNLLFKVALPGVKRELRSARRTIRERQKEAGEES